MNAGVDDFTLAASNLPPGKPALLFSGRNQVNGGAGAIFGAGLRCAGGGIVRLGLETSGADGTASWGPGLAAQGGWAAGDTRNFQCWYRNPTGPCATSNLTNGVSVTFAP